MPLCHGPCSCYPNDSLGRAGDWANEIYERWTLAHGALLVMPVHWYQAPGALGAMTDRLVCADGGDPDPTTTGGNDPKAAEALERRGWPYPKCPAGRAYGGVVHGDAAGAEALRRAPCDWLEATGLAAAGARGRGGKVRAGRRAWAAGAGRPGRDDRDKGDKGDNRDNRDNRDGETVGAGGRKGLTVVGLCRQIILRGMVDEIPMGVVVVGPRRESTFVNDAAKAILGLPAGAGPGGPAAALFGDHPGVRRALDDGGAPPEARLELALEGPGGRPLELALVVLRVPGGAAGGAGHVLLFHDARERRQRAVERLRDDRLAAVGQVAMGFAHEVRNPLAAMTAICEAMCYGAAAGDPQGAYAGRLLALVDRMSNIVKGTLRFGRPDAPQFGAHEPSRLLDEALDVLAPRCAAAGGRPRTTLAAGLPPVWADGGQAVQALVALLDNALDAVGRAERVGVGVRRCDDPRRGAGVAFDVSDDGPGIAAGALARVFDPFYTTKPRGTGLGLAIAQRLVIENGGQLLVTSEPGVATTFRAVLPAVGAAAAGAPAGAVRS
jgi:signal transduction histidine kinase